MWVSLSRADRSSPSQMKESTRNLWMPGLAGWNGNIKAVRKISPIRLKMGEQRLRWYGHMLRRPADHLVRLTREFNAPEQRPRVVAKVKRCHKERNRRNQRHGRRFNMKWRRNIATADSALARIKYYGKEESIIGFLPATGPLESSQFRKVKFVPKSLTFRLRQH